MVQPTLPLESIPRPHPECASRKLGGEIVVLTPADSKLHTLDELGSRIFELADGSRKVSDIVQQITEEYDVDLDTATRDTTEFVRALVDAKVLVLADEK